MRSLPNKPLNTDAPKDGAPRTAMPPKPVVAWIFPLVGHHFDLEDLPLYLEGSSATITKREDGYYLRLSATSIEPDHNRLRADVKELVTLLNGLTASLLHGVRPFNLADRGCLGIDEEGRVVNTVLNVQGSEIRSKAGHVTFLMGGTTQPDHRKGFLTSKLLAAQGSTALADALAIVGRASPSWSELYVVYELVKSNVGRRLADENWIEEPDARLFRWTANSYTALGRQSRHGKDTGTPPPAPMTHQTAISLIRSLVGKWTLFESRGGS